MLQPTFSFKIRVICENESNQGCNERKVISEVYHIFWTAVYCLWAVMQTQDRCHSLTWDPSFTWKKSMKYSGHGKLLWELSKLSKFNAFNLLGY